MVLCNVGIIKKSFAALAVIVLALFSSCQHTNEKRAVVNGSLADASGIKLILQEMDPRAIRAVDSVVPDHTGNFRFNLVVGEPGFWLLKAATGKIMVLLLDEGDHIELSGSARDFPDNVIMKGTEEAMILNAFFKQTRLFETAVDSLEMLLVLHQDSSDYYHFTQITDNAFRQILEIQRRNEIEFISRHPFSLGSLVVLNYAFGANPVLDPVEDFIYYHQLDSTLMEKFPENKHVRFHHQRVEEIKRSMSAGR
ncbi:MAG: DUF4369 domain-containing protein [Bacteroidales bacterium]|nr:DUF4369 domain-containing protein [Bacteroidales bacterium]